MVDCKEQERWIFDAETTDNMKKMPNPLAGTRACRKMEQFEIKQEHFSLTLSLSSKDI